MTTFIEPRLLYFQQEVARCIKDPAVVSHLAAESVITAEDSSRIKKLYIDSDTFKATEEMINCLLKSRARGKWASFLYALEQSEYHYLKTLLESAGRPYESVERAREIIRIFTPLLEKEINGKDIVSELYSKKVINQTDQELILATYQTKGDTYATIVLLERMQCRLAPDEWFYIFLNVLTEKGYKHVVEKIEPEFLQNPDQYRPVADFVEAEETMDDLAAPDSTAGPVSPELIGTETDSKTKISDSEELNELNLDKVNRNNTFREKEKTLGERAQPDGSESTESICQSENLKEFNIKPDISKSLTIDEVAPNKANVATCGTSCTNIDDACSELDDTDTENDDIDSETTCGSLKLRDYQVELAEKHAVPGRNTIICADTGTGKTCVAMYIIDKHLQTTTDGVRKVAFMARTGALIKQQADSLRRYLDSKYMIKLVTSDTDESKMLGIYLDGYDIICFTPQILVNNLDNKNIESISVFSLLILDECHHTRKDEPYNKLMRRYLLQKNEPSTDDRRLPQIVGLTASIGVGKAKGEVEALDHIMHVCACLDVRNLSTVEDSLEELKEYTNIPTEENIPMVKRDNDPNKAILLSAMTETESIIQEKSSMQPKLVKLAYNQPADRELQSYGTWANDMMTTAQSIFNSRSARDVASCAKYLQIYSAALEVNNLLRTEDIALYLAEKHQQEDENHDELTETEKTLFRDLRDVQRRLRREKNENPNVHIMSSILRKHFAGVDKDSRAMVFVQARATCKALASLLNQEFSDIDIRASPLFGKENRGSDMGMTESAQTDIINKFRDGHFKVIVATSVGTEGIDVPDCDITLNYNYTGNEITKIQMKGRSRKKGAKAVTLGNDKLLEREKKNVYRASLMTKAIKRFKEQSYDTICRKVLTFQREELRKYKNQVEVMNIKRSRQSSDHEYKVLCRDCSAYLCNTSDIRKCGSSFMVADENFQDKIRKRLHDSPSKFGTIQKQYKMKCNGCPLDLGIIGIKDGLECCILNIKALKFCSSVDGGITTYKKWIDMPYRILETTYEELPTE
ncbi:antiviral innate immune response receptor RIG-I-like isoform X2 [Mercenaria mercenaria]|uniref:antiviral innate immune response receptor RIG-I-like isoform X2 n=1 Tax=Mercenaria mercenaria TaxID=6596 RepID=UPI00234E4070|nr:antiviral innate immune response receptor RIG-I-like isoform X2 [Mercenaria mercenaria]